MLACFTANVEDPGIVIGEVGDASRGQGAKYEFQAAQAICKGPVPNGINGNFFVRLLEGCDGVLDRPLKDDSALVRRGEPELLGEVFPQDTALEKCFFICTATGDIRKGYIGKWCYTETAIGWSAGLYAGFLTALCFW